MSSMNSLNQGGRARSTYATTNGTIGIMKTATSRAMIAIAISQSWRSE